MAIVTGATIQAGNEVSVYDIPESVLQQYVITGDKAAQMFPESSKHSVGGIPKSTAAMNPTKLENAERLDEVQAYGDVCVCRLLRCNAYGCWFIYTWCYC